MAISQNQDADVMIIMPEPQEQNGKGGAVAHAPDEDEIFDGFVVRFANGEVRTTGDLVRGLVSQQGIRHR